jgi:hypothetical protein
MMTLPVRGRETGDTVENAPSCFLMAIPQKGFAPLITKAMIRQVTISFFIMIESQPLQKKVAGVSAENAKHYFISLIQQFVPVPKMERGTLLKGIDLLLDKKPTHYDTGLCELNI